MTSFISSFLAFIVHLALIPDNAYNSLQLNILFILLLVEGLSHGADGILRQFIGRQDGIDVVELLFLLVEGESDTTFVVVVGEEIIVGEEVIPDKLWSFFPQHFKWHLFDDRVVVVDQFVQAYRFNLQFFKQLYL